MVSPQTNGSPERLAATLPDEAAARQVVSELAAAGVDTTRIDTTDDGASVAPGRRRPNRDRGAPQRHRAFVRWGGVLGGVVGAVVGGMFLLPLAESHPWVVGAAALVGVALGALVGRRIPPSTGRVPAGAAAHGVRVVVHDVTPGERSTVEHLLRAASNDDGASG